MAMADPARAPRIMEIRDGEELIEVNIDDLEDAAPEEYIKLLEDTRCGASFWTRLAGEYWRRGQLDVAHMMCETAISKLNRSTLGPVYAMLANLELAQAQRAPKVILPDARADKLSGKTKPQHIDLAKGLLNRTGGLEVSETLLFLTRGIVQLASRSYEEALRTFDGILVNQPNNIVALTGRARIYFQRRQFAQALKTFQRVLQLAPNSLPDPRIGIGLCLWSLGAREKARLAWARSLELHEGTYYPALVLLGLAAINASKDLRLQPDERAQEYATGIKHVELAFKLNKASAAAANALAEMFLRKGPAALPTALKLAERTIQHADTLSLLADGHMRAGRALHAQGQLPAATKHYEHAPPVVGAVGLAAIHVQTQEYAAAIHVLEKILLPQPQQQQNAPAVSAPKLEVLIMLASLHAFARPGVSAADLAKGRARARELYDRALRELDHAGRELAKASGVVGDDARVAVRGLAEEVALHVEVARLWTEDPSQPAHAEKALNALNDALRVAKAANATADAIYARLVNNVGALRHAEGAYESARAMYEDALAVATALPSDEGEGISVSVLYNLGRCLEDMEEKGIAGVGYGAATEVYNKLLARHPEYVDAKVRLAHMVASAHRMNEAHELLKQALSSSPTALNLRAYYTNFLLRVNLWKPARDFAFSTLRDCDKNDVYALCASGIVLYHNAREAGRGFGGDAPMSSDERKKNFIRACEFFDKALQQDPACAVAAQGLAIALAEDALGTLFGALGTPPQGFDPTRSAREALDVFAKVRESLTDGAVYANMGHCYYARDEFDRAIESYETANKRFFEGRNVANLLCLSRAWYAKANKDQSFAAMRTALKYAQQAMHCTPGDKAIVYNIAMIQQKAAEMLFGLEPSRRSLADLRRAIEQAEHAQSLFASLAADTSTMLPYSRDIADQRRRYGDTMLRKRVDQLAEQERYEEEVGKKYDAVRQRRQEEQQRAAEEERVRQEEMKRRAEELAEQRRKAKAEVEEWTSRMQDESDEERERRAAKKRQRETAAVAGEDGSLEPGNAAPKKRKRPPTKSKRATKRAKGPGGEEEAPGVLPSEDEDEAMFSAPEAEPAPKRVPKKRVIKDDEDEDGAAATTSHKRKKFKSKEVISDSDVEE